MRVLGSSLIRHNVGCVRTLALAIHGVGAEYGGFRNTEPSQG